MSDSQRPHGLQPTRLLCPWIFQARVLEWGAIAFSVCKANEIFFKCQHTFAGNITMYFKETETTEQ